MCVYVAPVPDYMTAPSLPLRTGAAGPESSERRRSSRPGGDLLHRAENPNPCPCGEGENGPRDDQNVNIHSALRTQEMVIEI